MDVKALFPEGVLSIFGNQISVKTGPYYEPVADLRGGEWVLNDLGKALAPEVPDKPALVPHRAKRSAKAIPAEDTLDDLDV